jgi:aspartokinase
MKKRIVMKFGGTSVGGAKAIKQVSTILLEHPKTDYEIAVVVSAAAGITNSLNTSILQAQNFSEGDFEVTLEQAHLSLEKTSENVIKERSAKRAFSQTLLQYFQKANSICQDIKNEDIGIPRLVDQVLSIGECIQIHLVAASLKQNGIPCIPIQSSQIIKTDSCFQNAAPIQPITNHKIYEKLIPF